MEMILGENMETKIYEIRGSKVMLDSDFSQRVQAQGRSCMKWRRKG